MIYKLVLGHVDLGHYKSLRRATEAYNLVEASMKVANVDISNLDFCLVIVRE